MATGRPDMVHMTAVLAERVRQNGFWAQSPLPMGRKFSSLPGLPQSGRGRRISRGGMPGVTLVKPAGNPYGFGRGRRLIGRNGGLSAASALIPRERPDDRRMISGCGLRTGDIQPGESVPPPGCRQAVLLSSNNLKGFHCLFLDDHHRPLDEQGLRRLQRRRQRRQATRIELAVACSSSITLKGTPRTLPDLCTTCC